MENAIINKTTRRLASVGVALSMLLVAIGIGGAPRLAYAHAELTSSTPANGATVQEGLTLITLIFDEEISVDKSTGELMGPNGSAVSGATASVDRAQRSKMTIQTPALTPGTYTVKWGAFNDDDNNLANGTFTFTVAAATAGQGGTSTEVPPTDSLPTSGAGDGASMIMLLLLGCGVLLAGSGLLLRQKSARHSA